MQKLLGNLKKGLFFVVSAPSGTGKTTLVRKLTKELDSIIESVSFTTRKPRAGEIEGVDYFFVSEKEFLAKVKRKEFLEYAKVLGNYYGTSRTWVNKHLTNKKHVVLVIDTQGALQLKGKINGAFIFIAPPNLDELKSRLLQRDNDKKSMKKRVDLAKKELKISHKYDYNIINEDLHVTYEILRSIVIAEEHRVRKI
ncbi:MAG: guanylate kinase [Chlamydiae bacterium]|nr:guanylate kinase [Chlamydiota bacterium]